MSTVFELIAKPEFNEIYNFFYAGNYHDTIQLAERYAAREGSSELFRAIYQSYRLRSFYLLSNSNKCTEESHRLLSLASTDKLKGLYRSFLEFEMRSGDAASEEDMLIGHFMAINHCYKLAKEKKLPQIIDLLASFPSSLLGSHFELERLSVIGFSALCINQVELCRSSVKEMKRIHVDAIPTLILVMVFQLYLKNLSAWSIASDEEGPLEESLTAIQEIIESYGGPMAIPQLTNLCNVASMLLGDAPLYPTLSDPTSTFNSLWHSFRKEEANMSIIEYASFSTS